ncbi:hypothetical protein HN011_003206 [Eciton burchellii]|nr:hypothetical protein HN011_003206 [Eciton burchellii]
MRLPILVLCLAVVYGTCRIYGENVDLIDREENDKSDYPMVPMEVALSRHKRGVLSPDFGDFINGVFGGQLDLCPEGEKLSFSEWFKKAFVHPISTLQDIVCKMAKGIGRESLAAMHKFFKIFSQFFTKIFLPKLHAILNLLLKTRLMPAPVVIAIEIFNAFYAFLKLTGNVK